MKTLLFAYPCKQRRNWNRTRTGI